MTFAGYAERHLDGPNQALPICGSDAPRRVRIPALQDTPERPHPPLRHDMVEARAQLRLASRSGYQAPQERPQIKPCSSGHDRQTTPGGHGLDDLVGVPDIVSCAVIPIRVGAVDQVVCHALAKGRRRFCSPGVEPLVHLHRIGADDLSSEAFRKSYGNGALPHPGRSGEHEDHRLQSLSSSARSRSRIVASRRCGAQ